MISLKETLLLLLLLLNYCNCAESTGSDDLLIVTTRLCDKRTSILLRVASEAHAACWLWQAIEWCALCSLLNVEAGVRFQSGHTYDKL